MRPGVWLAVAGAAGVVASVVWPLPGASATEMPGARLACAALTVAALAIVHLIRGGRKGAWLGVALVSVAGGAALLFLHVDALHECVASYAGRPTVIGREHTPRAIENIDNDPSLTNPELLLLDTGGDAALAWTSESIRSCRQRVTWSALLAVPLFTLAAGALVALGRRRFAIAPLEPVAAAGAAPSEQTRRYDAFISYRHGEPDASYALEIVQSLEARGLRVAIDYRDFAPNEHFLTEIERCIKTSRFVLCVITSRYVTSDNTSEEAIISKTLDLAERRRRLVPLLFERVGLPVWLYGLSGIDCTPDAAVDPIERLLALVLPDRIDR